MISAGTNLVAALLASIVLCTVLISERASAQLPESTVVSVSPAHPVYPQDSQVAWQVRMTTGALPASVGMYWFGPAWPGGREFEGGPLRFGQPSLIGPGELRHPRRFGVGILMYGITAACYRGDIMGRTGDQDAWEIHIPPGSETTLVVPAGLNAAPWPGIDYTPGFSLFGLEADGDPIGNPAKLVSPTLSWSGISGVHIRTWARIKKRAKWDGLKQRSPRLFGTTNPPLVNQSIELRAVRIPRDAIRQISINIAIDQWDQKQTVRLGKVQTAADGSFRLRRQHRLRHGTYRVLANYSGGQPGVVADWNCGPLFHVADPRADDR